MLAAICRILTIQRSNRFLGEPDQTTGLGGSVNVGRDGGSVARDRALSRARYVRAGGASAPWRTGYTIAHAGRQIRFGPVAFWIAVGTVVIMAGWSLTAATYFAFREDVLRGLLARQAEQQYAYEDRIAELRARIDRTTSRQLLDQEQFEQKLEDLLRRQGMLESRATALSGMLDPATTGSIRPTARGGSEPTANTWFSRDHRSFLDPNWMQTNRQAGKSGDIAAKLARAETSLERIERHQSLTLAQIQERYEGKARRLRNVFADLGLKVERTARTGERRTLRAGQAPRRRQWV